MPTEVFLSYRREDTEEAQLLGSWLSAHFGSERIFMDVHRLQGGESFPAAIAEAIASCKAIVMVVGGDWSNGLHEEGDWVRRELREGLEAGRPIVPVLVHGVPPLVAGDLPAELAPLADLHAVAIGDADQGEDFDRLVEVLERRGVTPALQEAFPGVPPRDWGEVRGTWDATGTEGSVRERLEAALQGRGLRVAGSEDDYLVLAGGSRLKFRLFGGYFGSESRLPVDGRLRIRRRGAFVSIEVLLAPDPGPGIMNGLGGRFESHFNNVIMDLRRATARNA